jgi:hypothetical protein
MAVHEGDEARAQMRGALSSRTTAILFPVLRSWYSGYRRLLDDLGFLHALLNLYSELSGLRRPRLNHFDRSISYV